MTDYHDLSALEQARALRERRFSSEALTRHYLDQIERHNPDLGAFVSVQSARALKAARRADKKLAAGAGERSPVFLGVPTGIKDLDLARGTWTRMGTRAYRHLWSPVDGPVARRVRAGGFVIVGKLATSEFAIMPVTETDIHPPCRNPWNRAHSPGGSSGGSASAVAGGLLPIAQASDGAGSIRIPASFCHLVGFKPSRGLTPNFYRAFDPVGMTTVGSVSRDVEDTAAMFDVLTKARYDPRRPPEGSFLSACATPPRRLRIAFTDTSPLGRAEPHLCEAVRAAAEVLASLGHHVEEGSTESGTIDEFVPIYAQMTSLIPVLRESDLQPATRWLREVGRGFKRADTRATAAELARRVEGWFGASDIWLGPTVPVAPPKVGAWSGLDGESAFRAAAMLGASTAVFNISGQPAVNLPVGLTEDNLPIGVQLSARKGQDRLLLALAREFEQAAPWRARSAISGR